MAGYHDANLEWSFGTPNLYPIVKINCPKCGATLKVVDPDPLATHSCPKCQAVFRAPSTKGSTPLPTASTPPVKSATAKSPAVQSPAVRSSTAASSPAAISAAHPASTPATTPTGKSPVAQPLPAPPTKSHVAKSIPIPPPPPPRTAAPTPPNNPTLPPTTSAQRLASIDDLPALKLDEDEDLYSKPSAVPPLAAKPTASVNGATSAATASSVAKTLAPPIARQSGKYRFSQACKLCGTRVDFTSGQIGETTACPDCFSAMEIREPGPEQERRPLSEDRFGEPDSLSMEADPAAASRLDAPDALRQRADQLLEKAAAVLRAEQREEQDGRFNDAAAGRLLSVFAQRETLARLVVISLSGMVAFALLDWHIGRVIAGVGNGVAQFSTGAVALGACGLWFALLAAHAMALLRGSLADLSSPIPWPPLLSDAWIRAPWRIAFALMAAGLPGLVPGLALVFAGLPSWLGIPLLLASEVGLFPVIMLSMERRDGSWNVYEPGIGDDLLAVWPATATFYQAAALLGILALFAMAAVGLGSPWYAVIQGPALAAIAMVGARLLGWLNIALISPSVDD